MDFCSEKYYRGSGRPDIDEMKKSLIDKGINTVGDLLQQYLEDPETTDIFSGLDLSKIRKKLKGFTRSPEEVLNGEIFVVDNEKQMQPELQSITENYIPKIIAIEPRHISSSPERNTDIHIVLGPSGSGKVSECIVGSSDIFNNTFL